MRKTDRPKEPDELRRTAEERLAGRAGKIKVASEADARALLHELQVYQIELEIQNEELRRINAELEESHRRYTDLVDFAPIGYFTIDEKGDILHANLAAAELLGVNRSNLKGTNLRRLVASESLSAFDEFCLLLAQTTIKQTREVTLLRNKSRIHVVLVGITTDLAEDDVRWSRIAVFDITDRKEAEKSLQKVSVGLESRIRERTREFAESEERYRSLVDYSPDAIVVLVDGIVKFINHAGLKLAGAAHPKEVLGRPYADFIHPDSIEGVRERLASLKEEEPPLWIERKYLRVDGRPIEVEATATPIVYKNKPAVLAILRDITERKRAEQWEREREANKREFYRRTILAATGGRLVIAERGEIRDLAAGPPLGSWTFKKNEDLATARRAAIALAESLGMDERGLQKLATCFGEATTNSLKHAGGGAASLHRMENGLLLTVEDRGPGIRSAHIPDVALVAGYSTVGTLGMGYKLIIASAEKVYLDTGPEGTTVSMEVRLENLRNGIEIFTFGVDALTT